MNKAFKNIYKRLEENGFEVYTKEYGNLEVVSIDTINDIVQEVAEEYAPDTDVSSIAISDNNECYNKAIDDFSEKIKENISESLIWGMLVDSHKDNSFNDTSDKIVDYVIDTVKKVAEQLKEREA